MKGTGVFLTTAGLTLIGFAGPSCHGSPASPGPHPIDPNIPREFRLAQTTVATEYDQPCAREVEWHQFVWVPVDGAFQCGGEEANGCFTPPRTIRYNFHTPTVLRHEAGHAILYRIGDPRWQCYEHDPGCPSQ
jgi:hypothetical protein